ncbi:MAG: RtcB family protein [Desulfovibrionaceae bacterium]|nr:RtcB family protein [Desulfovibrionaceae bacterium]
MLSGSLDESPSAYKDIHEVVAAQSDLIKVLARFEPKIVKMAHSEKFRKKKDKGAE